MFMTEQCPNCSKEFIEQRETAFRCEVCGWLKNVDGVWHSCPEPVKVVDVPTPPEPDPPREPDPPGPALNVRSYLGGLVTVTTEDEEDEEND
jgi:hypothetical protein